MTTPLHDKADLRAEAMFGALTDMMREFARLAGNHNLSIVFTCPPRNKWSSEHDAPRPTGGNQDGLAGRLRLNHWPALTNHLLNGEVSIDNNSIENLVRPWAMACS